MATNEKSNPNNNPNRENKSNSNNRPNSNRRPNPNNRNNNSNDKPKQNTAQKSNQANNNSNNNPNQNSNNNSNPNNKKRPNRNWRKKPRRKKTNENSNNNNQNNNKNGSSSLLPPKKGETKKKVNHNKIVNVGRALNDITKQLQNDIKDLKDNTKDCVICSEKIDDMLTALKLGDDRFCHFQCAQNKILEKEELKSNETLTYIGNGDFSVMQKRNNRGKNYLFMRKRITRDEQDF